jgi:hypothetical protein
MPNILDVFNSDAFNVLTLTESLNKMPYVERRLGQLGLFSTKNLDTRTVVIDETEGQIQILGTKPLNAPAQAAIKEKLAKARAFTVPHIPFTETIQASELAGKRMPGETDMQVAIRKVNDRLQWMRDQVESTWEIHRLGALKGIVLDADGTTEILNMFDAFEVTQQTNDFAFSSATTDVRKECVTTSRMVEAKLGGVPYSRIHVLAGKNWFDALVGHARVEDTFKYQQGQTNRDDLRYAGFNFGGLTFEEYRGMTGLAGNIGIIGDDEAYAFPLGVPDLFRANFAPGNFMETVNQVGIPLYAKVAPDAEFQRFVKVLIETNPLFMNTRPDTVIKLTKS